MFPRYLNAFQNGSLKQAADKAFSMLESCRLCPHECKADRLKDQKGICKTGLKAVVYSFGPHHGEEPPISGKRGSGTIFFSNCNMRCAYCQNYEFSQRGEGRAVENEELAQMMISLQTEGCHNINLVTPTHIMPQILKALEIAVTKGLNIPIVYNTGGYELPEVIKLLDGIVDIYMPDMRYADHDNAIKYSCAIDYPKFNQASVKEMYRQVGNAEMDENGVLKMGLLIRHLVLPRNIAATEKVMKFISEELSKDVYISLMSQYFPYYKATEFKELSRRITFEEYEAAIEVMHAYGLHNGWTQDSYGLKDLAGVNIKPFYSK